MINHYQQRHRNPLYALTNNVLGLPPGMATELFDAQESWRREVVERFADGLGPLPGPDIPALLLSAAFGVSSNSLCMTAETLAFRNIRVGTGESRLMGMIEGALVRHAGRHETPVPMRVALVAAVIGARCERIVHLGARGDADISSCAVIPLTGVSGETRLAISPRHLPVLHAAMLAPVADACLQYAIQLAWPAPRHTVAYEQLRTVGAMCQPRMGGEAARTEALGRLIGSLELADATEARGEAERALYYLHRYVNEPTEHLHVFGAPGELAPVRPKPRLWNMDRLRRDEFLRTFRRRTLVQLDSNGQPRALIEVTGRDSRVPTSPQGKQTEYLVRAIRHHLPGLTKGHLKERYQDVLAKMIGRDATIVCVDTPTSEFLQQPNGPADELSTLVESSRQTSQELAVAVTTFGGRERRSTDPVPGRVLARNSD